MFLRERGESEIWLDNIKFRPDFFGVFSLDTWVNNDPVTWNPIDRCSNLVLVTSLKRVHNTENLLGVAAGGCWVGENETDGLLWINDEDGSDGESLPQVISL
jgi:hypothetical protein